MVREPRFLSVHLTDMRSAAVSMALCELSTAGHSPPLECVGFANPHAAGTAAEEKQHQGCVE